MKRYILLFFILLSSLTTLKGQASSAILEKMQQFSNFKVVLYLAAHPDDENTRVISWLVSGEHARAGYLSLTRGDGGQNLIGKEFGADLGILRTRELLAARAIDGGEQYFSRAVDFGYSRSAEETLEKWDEQKILADVVWVIRKFKPQLIITRFPPDERAGHGHHTASAMMAEKAFELAADKNAFPEQLAFVSPWQVQSVYWNGSTWWDKTLESDMQKDSSIWRADIGGYNPLTGHSNNELGSLARSQHKCQGFGVDIQRGETFEYFRPLAGKSLYRGLQGLETPSWESLGVAEVEKMYADLEAEFDPFHPEKSLNLLAGIFNTLNQVKDDFWREIKQEQCKELIVACSGLFAEALVENYVYQPGNPIKVQINFLSRLTDQLSIDGVSCETAGIYFKQAASLPKNQFATYDLEVPAPDAFAGPYWLKEPFENTYSVHDQALIGKPENDPVLLARTNLLVNNIGIPLEIPVKYKWRDRVEGELQREIVIAPPFTINFSEPMFVALNDEPIHVKAKIKWLVDSGQYDVNFVAAGWEIEEPKRTISSSGFEKEEWLDVVLKPKSGTKSDVLSIENGAGVQVLAYKEIAYSHIPTQVNLPPAEAKLAHIELKKTGKRVAYVVGAGDQVAAGIAQMGYQVDELGENEMASADLSVYQAVVVGIRAYNTHKWLLNYNDKLNTYVEQGGNVIVQYNTANRFDNEERKMGPYAFKIGRNRVTEEDAEVNILLKKNPVFSKPNRISDSDFKNWVQERGLYFAEEWDDNFVAPISWHDKGQEDAKGALIIGEYGKGAFMYTGISFFRQLPAGVPGAYRLLANLISYSSSK